MLNQVWVLLRRLALCQHCACNDLPTALSDEDNSKIPDVSIVESSAEMLYGLVHQRFILTRAGLQAMVS